MTAHLHELAALAAAACWAFNGLIAAPLSQQAGAVSFNRARMSMVFVMLGAQVTARGGWASLDRNEVLAILGSGFVGILLGDTAQFLALNRLGPRRTAILFAMNAPLSAVLGWVVLGERLSGQAMVGIATAIIGVVLAIAFGTGRGQVHHWERVRGRLWIALGLGCAAALAQAIGSLIARPIMASGADSVLVSALRVGVAALGLSLLIRLPQEAFRPASRFTAQMLAMTALSGALGMGVGMTLIMFALSGGNVGVVSTLAATTPAMLLPLLWVRTRERPAAGAWAGAAMVVVGTALIFMD